MITRLLIMILMLMQISQCTAYASNVNQSHLAVATYTGENGISIISYSTAWNTKEQLKKVYQELMSNTHGDEIAYLSTIYIYPDSKNGVGSYYFDGYSKGKDGKYIYKKDRTIIIYNGDQNTNISQISRMISHEYGHHFTFYYLLTHENIEKNQWLESKYAQVRGLSAYKEITFLGDLTKDYNHKWDIAEILAEDYVQLYGSPLAKKSRDYYDVKERIDFKTSSYYFYYLDFNLLPQENLNIPLAADVKGLTEYFETLSGVDLPNHPEDIYASAPELTEINAVYKEFNEYIFEWNEASSDEKNSRYEYTLVMNPVNFNDYPIPLKTVSYREKLRCIAGSAVDSTKEQGVFKNYVGEYELRLFIKDSNDFMHGSPMTALSITPLDNDRASVFKGTIEQSKRSNYNIKIPNWVVLFLE